jgi:ArsR family transcriptional regulator
MNTQERPDAEVCDYMFVHQDIVKRVMASMPDEDVLYDVCELFRLFGDSTRIRILCVLFESEMCVCDIAQLLSLSQSAVSHQLQALRNAKLIRARREGKVVFYSLADDHVRSIIGQGLDHVTE